MEHEHSGGPTHPHESADHGHRHGWIDPAITTSQRGMWAIKWSCAGLLVTAFLQLAVVGLSGSVALLADTLHNIGDAATALPLGIAFLLVRWPPTSRLTYGYGRVEDLAGIAVVLTMLATALVVLYESINRLFHPQPVAYLWAVMAAALVGFIGNEAVAIFGIGGSLAEGGHDDHDRPDPRDAR
ncbi:MAG: cation diffusion facilitator family transporter [Candidatus Entotheonellia bacterium]